MLNSSRIIIEILFMVVYNSLMYSLIFIGLSFLLSIIAMPIIIKLCNSLQIFDYQNSRKIHTGNISRLGGIGIVVPFFICCVAYLYFNDQEFFSLHLHLLIAGFIIFAFALIDDLVNLPAIVKLLGQLLASAIVVFNDVRFTQIFSFHLPTFLSYFITFFWIVALINAFNLIDGLDGLCGSLSFTTITTVGILFALSHNSVSVFCFILAASILGFLCFNWPPAKLFMGDNGSQFLGFIIAIMPIYNSVDYLEFNKVFMMIILTSIPSFDFIAAIWRRLRDKRPIMSADSSHLHHKLLNLGYTKQQALYLLLFLQIIICCSVILSSFFTTQKALALLIESMSLAIFFFSIVHFTNRKRVKQLQSESQTN